MASAPNMPLKLTAGCLVFEMILATGRAYLLFPASVALVFYKILATILGMILAIR